MATKQMTIDDYLNTGNAVMVNTAEIETADKIEIETMDYKSMTKDELVKTVEAKDAVIKNYETVTEETREKHSTELQNMDEYYRAKVQELNNIINYYQRKITLIKDLIDIETGGEK